MTYTSWAKAALIRMIRTGAQAALGFIGASAVLADVAWDVVLGGTALAMIVSLLMSLAGLPETTEDAPLEHKRDGGQVNYIGLLVIVFLMLLILRVFHII
jgi:hypothetical protein